MADDELQELIYTEITDEKLLSFIFKKKGTVNATNLQYLVTQYGNKQIAQNLINLKTAGLIRAVDSHIYKVTFKARWRRIRDNKTIIFWGIIAAIVATLILLMQVIHILK